jgi:tetratricopeptide (TPR) repeat protein
MKGDSTMSNRLAAAALAATLLALAPPAPAADSKELSEKVTKMFKGKADLYGKNILRVAYDFSSEDQLQDFNQQCEGKIVDGQLELQASRGIGFWNVKGAIFENYTSFEADVTLTGTGSEAGVLVFFSFKEGAGYGFSLNGAENQTGRSKPAHYIRRWATKTMGGQTYWDVNNLGTTSKPELAASTKYRWKAVARQGTLQMTLNGAPLLAKQDTTFNKGYLCLCATGGSVRFDNVKIEGAVDLDWLRKALSEADTLVTRDKIRDQSEKEKPVLVTFEPLSAESKAVMDKVDKGAVKVYEEGCQLQTVHQFDKAIELFSAALKATPAFPAALFHRAQCYQAKEQEDKAEQDLDEAVAQNPEFYEAYKEKGDLYLGRNLFTHALAFYNKALAVKKDYGGALASRAYLYLVQGDRDKAVKEIAEAAQSAPTDLDVLRVQRQLKNVTSGPPWAKEKTFTRETTHYIVKTDISEKAAAFYAAQLEAIYTMYTGRFGYRADNKLKARAYIFETREGYLTYAELSTNNRPEMSLGYYHPHYRELLIFEGMDKELTLRVLYHEGFHQFLHQFLPHPPYWFNEGVAEFFGASRVEGGTVVATGLVQEGRLRNVQALLGSNILKRFSDLLKSSERKDFYSGYVGANYAQAWSIVHFFFNYDGGKYAPLLREYYKVIRDGGEAKTAYEAAFGKVNLSAMEKEWQEYVKKLEPPKK